MQNYTNAFGHAPLCIRFRKFSRNLLSCLLYLVFAGVAASAQIRKSATDKLSPGLRQQVMETLRAGSRKIQFIENCGQQDLPAQVLAYGQTGNQLLFIEKDRLQVMILKKEAAAESLFQQPLKGREKMKWSYNSFSIIFRGSTGLQTIDKNEKQPVIRNYFRKNQKEQAAAFGEIILRSVYPKTDLRLYAAPDGQLEFDWLLWPGADMSKIRMEFEGQQNLRLEQGNLRIKLAMGGFSLHMPESYYALPGGKQKADIRFQLRGKNKIGFKQFSPAHPEQALVIDPQLMWGTFFDGGITSFDEYLYSIDFNFDNNLIYCAGSANLQVSNAYAAAFNNSYDSSFNSSTDVLVYALTANGEEIKFISYFGGTGDESGYGISVAQNTVFICGYTASVDFPLQDSSAYYQAYDTSYQGISDGFVVVMNESLTRLNYCSFLGGPGKDAALTIRAMDSTTYYVSLTLNDTLSVSKPDYLFNAADNIYAGASEAWIGKFSYMNSLDYGTYIGGNSDDLVNDFQILGNGDLVFAGYSNQINEVNASVPDNATGKDALFGRLSQTHGGVTVFPVLERFGGSGTDQAWGISCLGDSISVIVGQTSSNGFPLGAGPVFQNTRAGGTDGFIARINNDGTGNYTASFVGGSNADILVSVRLITLYNSAYLMSFGSTQSTDLAVKNYNSENFYSATNSGGLDMMFLITKLDLSTKVYLSYVGGSANDYLGATGAPLGSNHLFYNARDSVLYVGTTTHSNQTTHAPQFVGRGWADAANALIPVFDSTKNNSNNDTHVIIAISTTSLLVLPQRWDAYSASLTATCLPRLRWNNPSEEGLKNYVIEYAENGLNFRTGGILQAGSGTYMWTGASPLSAKTSFRIRAERENGTVYYSPVLVLEGCGQTGTDIRVFPVIARDHLNVMQLPSAFQGGIARLFDTQGRQIQTWNLAGGSQSVCLNLQRGIAASACFLIIQDTKSGKILKRQQVIIQE